MYERNPKDVSTCPPPDTATGMDALREFGYTNGSEKMHINHQTVTMSAM